MKKRVLLIAFAILAALSFATCQSAPAEPTIPSADLAPAEPLQTYPALENYVSMTVTNIRANSARTRIQNDSDWTLSVDYWYTLEIYDNGQWREVPVKENFVFPSIVWGSVYPSENAGFPIDLSAFPSVGAGLYRIRKEVWIGWQADELIDGYPIGWPDEMIEPEGRSGDTRHEIVAEFQWGG